MSTDVAVSVVVPTYQRRSSLGRLLEALGRQTLPYEEFEVVVVVDGSTDGSCEMLSTLATPYALRMIWQPNRGRASACNAGIRESRGEIVVLLDDDMEPQPTLLEEHRGAHAHHPRLGLLGAVPIPIDAACSPTARWVGTKFNQHLAVLSRAGGRIGARSFYSGNFSIRRTVLGEVGAFDESFREYGNEDVEFAIRLLAAGVDLAYSSCAVAVQHYEKDFPALARDHIAKGRTAVQCARKHPAVAARLRLGTYRDGDRRWRLLRAALLAWGGATERGPELLIRSIGAVERVQPAVALRLYTPALDVCFWFGVRAALHEHGTTLTTLLAEPPGAGGGT